MSNINFECIICLENIKFASVGSCTHHFCYYCLYKHCNYSNKCPLCKTIIHEIKIDREFDLLINNTTFPYLEHQNEIIIDPLEYHDSTYCLGFTIKNNTNGPGIVITNLKNEGIFKKYFELYDVIISINSVPSINHEDVMNQIQYLFKSNIIIKIIPLKI
jgi:hypothetical protein